MLGKAMRIVTVCTLAFAICADRAGKTSKTVPSKAWTNRRLLAKSLLLGASVQAASGFVQPPHPARGLGRPAGVRPHEPLKGWGLEPITEALAAPEEEGILWFQKMIFGKKAPMSPNAATHDPSTFQMLDADVAGDADTAGELLIEFQKQKEQTNLGGDSEYPELRKAFLKKVPNSLNAAMDDLATLEAMLVFADIAGGADRLDELLTTITEPKEQTAGELLIKFQKQKEQTNLGGDSEYPELRKAFLKKVPNSLNAAMDDLETLETMLVFADIAGDADRLDELLTTIKELKEQTNLDGESE